MDTDPRYIAFQVLMDWQRSIHTLDRSLEKYSAKISNLAPKDKTLCHALIFGVLRQRQAIDWIIQAFSTARVEKIKLSPLYLLRLALYQILYLDRIPVFAAIDTAVEIGKRQSAQKTAGFINAVLRKAANQHSTVVLPDKIKTPALYLSVHCSLPLWLAERWLSSFGFERTINLCEQINTIPMITARANTLKITRDALADSLARECKNVSQTLYAQSGLHFSHPDVMISDLTTFKKGWLQIQDEAAQLVTEYLDPQPGETILDACAGLGGKTCHMGQLMENNGRLVAVDIEQRKLDGLTLEARRLGITHIQTRAIDVIKTSIKDFDGYFDRVLVDAPCTGLGVIRRNPDTRWKRTGHDIARLSGRQKKILNAAANLVKPGGILVYAVCSCEHEENEAVVDAFLSKRKDFSIDKDIKSDNYAVLLTPDGFMKTYPETHDMDGFFAARLKRHTR